MDNNFDDIFNEDRVVPMNTPPSSGDNKKPKKKMSAVLISLILTLVIVASLVGGIFIGRATDTGMSKDQAFTNEVYEIAKEFYYEDLTREEFDYLFAIATSSTLDKFSGLLLTHPENTGEYGFRYDLDKYSTKTVSDVSTGSDLYGKLYRGDVIVEAKFDEDNWVDVEHMVEKNFRELIDTSKKASLKVRRDGIIVTIDTVDKSMEEIEDKKVFYQDTAIDGVGYVRFKKFASDVSIEFLASMDDFVNSGNNVMILDMRNNPGGLVSEITKIMPNFIKNPTGKDHIMTVDMRKYKDEVYYTEPLSINKINGGTVETVKNTYIGDKVMKKTGKPFKLIIVANDMSASASEAFIGNIKHYMDRDDYLLLGESEYTYGKGIAQNDFRLSNDNFVLRLTIGKYYVMGEKGTEYQDELTNIHGVGYKLDNSNITAEYKADRRDESAIVEAIRRAQVDFLDALI